MRWIEEGIVIDHKSCGESSKIISVFTRNRGLYRGLYTKSKILLQIGDLVLGEWRSRNETCLGFFKCELLRTMIPSVFWRFERLVALNAATSILYAVLPQRQSDEVCYDVYLNFILALAEGKDWRKLYIEFELTILECMGFGLSLAECTVSGSRNNISYISPRTGRAVSEDAAGSYKNKLLPFPMAFKYLHLGSDFHLKDLHFVEALKVTGYFLRKHLLRFIPSSRKQILTISSKSVIANSRNTT